MKKKILKQTLFALCIPWVLAQAGTGKIGKEEIHAINKAIQARGAKWTAAENPMTKEPFESMQALGVDLFSSEVLAKARRISLPQIGNLPAHFDWRDNNGNWVTPVKNQYSPNLCESCGIFAAVAQTESWLKIKNGDPNAEIDLSEQFIVSGGKIGTCSPTTGFDPFNVLEFIQTTGIPPEACMPYTGQDIPINQACPDWKDQCTKIPGWGVVAFSYGVPVTENIKNAVSLQPVAAGMLVQDDFPSYSGGVYEPVWGNLRAGHMVLIIGWDDAEQCWICKNSWGEGWGEAGFFRIKWGASSIGIQLPIIWSSTREMVDFSIQPNGLDFNLTSGDTVNETLSLFNKGSEDVEYATLPYEVSISRGFHPDAFNSYDGMSLWCGNPEVKGYNNYSLQYLDLPCLSLSETVQPKLTFMTDWSVETPNVGSDYIDGWDGSNVWISTDNGKTFRVVPQITPPYNCKSLNSLSYMIWMVGNDIPGWGGSSNGWKPVELDLSPFKTDSVVVRFAFASDGGFCTLDDPGLKGFFIDEIQVSDGEIVLFENHGDALAVMKTFGAEMMTHGTYLPQKAKWLNVSNGVGSIAPGDSSVLEIGINTQNIASGQYNAMILLSYNNERVWTSNNHLPIRLGLKKPTHDVGIDGVWPLGHNMPILVNENRVKIRNYGANDEKDFEVVLQLSKNGQAVSEERFPVPLLAAGDSLVVTLNPVLGTDIGEFDRSISIRKVADDYNAFNDSQDLSIHLSNLVDDFESETGLWDCRGGWGVTTGFKHSGSTSCHVNSGKGYTPNMNAVMTLKPTFDVLSLKNAYLQYWTKYTTEKDKDVLYTEASTDSMNWVKLDSLSGTGDWVQERVDLSRMLGAGTDHLWIRFHFQSDRKTQKQGVFIDDVEIHPEAIPINGIAEGVTVNQPGKWELAQNYPNPFNPSTTILYSLAEKGYVDVKIHDLLGREIRTLFAGDQTAGSHRTEWNGFDDHGLRVPSGIYFYTLTAKGFRETHKLVMLK